MSIVSLLNVSVLNNPANFMDPYEFEITFECLEPLKEDLEWKLIYVGASKSSKYDQELDSLLVGPVPQGVNRFIFQTDPPRPDLIPQEQLVSITVMLLSCSYKGREFVQVGYYVNNEYDTEELRENPPSRVALDHVVRNILSEKPRVTKYNIPWDSEDVDEYPPEQPDVDAEADDDEDAYGNEEEDLRDEMIDDLEAGDVDVEDEPTEAQADDSDEGEAEVEGEDDGQVDDADDDAGAAEPEPDAAARDATKTEDDAGENTAEDTTETATAAATATATTSEAANTQD